MGWAMGNGMGNGMANGQWANEILMSSAPCSLLPALCSLLSAPCSLLPAPCLSCRRRPSLLCAVCCVLCVLCAVCCVLCAVSCWDVGGRLLCLLRAAGEETAAARSEDPR